MQFDVSLLQQFFLLRDGAPTALLLGSYEPWQVWLSLVVATLTSALALQLAGMAARHTTPSARRLTVLSGSVAMGGGIWAMHFIGMLAFQLCTVVEYHAGLTLLSMLPALLASWVALSLLSRSELGRWSWVTGGVLVGAGIGAMHYLGMAAMKMSVQLRYDPLWFAASIVVAVLLAMLALWIRFGLQGRVRPAVGIALGGLVMGCAIAGMHYTAMVAARFVGAPDDHCLDADRSGYLALAITVVTLTISVLTAGANGLLRYRALNRQLGAERLRVQETLRALRDSEQQYRSLMANSPGVNFRCNVDANWSMVLISEAMETLSGWPAQDFLAGRIHTAELVHADDRERVNALVHAAMSADEAYVVEYRLMTRDGGERWVSETGRGVGDQPGNPRWIDGVITDVSDAKRLQHQLEDAKERAEAAVVAKSAFLANMSHEIRTPMNAILGFTELLLDTTLSDTQRKYLTTVRGSARSLLGLLNDILDTAKLEKGAVELERMDFSLRAVCEQTLNSLRLGAQRKGLVLQLDYPEEEPRYFQGDPLRVQQVLVNIVGNAIKFTEQGAVTLRMRQEQGQIHLAVIDTGIGIAADRLDKIFDPFAQADASTTRRFGGTGLGTTISRQLVERMGGRITVDSTLGQGSCFHIWLPLPAGKAVQGIAGEEEASISLPPLRLLVADDVPQNGELLQVLLGQDGHQVHLVTNGLQALQAVSERDFDAVLMDVHMPELDGLAATRRIRQFELANGRPRTPVIALTASVLEEDRQAALAAGMDGFSTKPVEPVRLRAELARVLGLAPVSLPASENEAASESTVDATVLDLTQAVKLWGHASAWRRALRRFAVEQADGGPRLMALLRAGEWLEARALAHRWRGVAGSLALPRLLAAARPLEEDLRLGLYEQAVAGGATLVAALDEALQAITELGDASAASSPMPLDNSPRPAPAAVAGMVPPELLRRLEEALRHGELDDAGVHELSAHVGAERCAALVEALDQFDFDAALRELRRLVA
ncbi:MHYT domain-containing protein [Roseateles asaccharophilus]|uniref:histidine kinase n=1 Tax=Roseateles asaccharophilus TaxID=582607 RepID=A0ABU2A4H2_9BURK|nr:MHYT domain-containing protein [Roseateles asaccharophilus]MDR7332005.1 PAS domain S-box-containing protein [Roseateles asaccharophilus]